MLAFAAFAVALAVRVYWILKVQSPYRSLYNDMVHYSEHARFLQTKEWGPDPERMAAFFPWGASYWYRLEHILSGGYENDVSVCVWNALTCAVATPCLVLIGARLTSSRAALVLLAIASALWHPQITFIGYFTSETPFIAAVLVASWCALRTVETGKGGFWLGLACAWAFATRPQFMLTMLLCAPLVLFHKQAAGRKWRMIASAAIPLALVMSFSAYRFHRLTGRWGLISENGPFQRLLGDTKIGVITSHWTDSKGRRWGYWFSPPSKGTTGEMEVFEFEGFIADPEILETKRKSLMKDVTLRQRVARWNYNVRILFWGEPMWPEVAQAKTPFRERCQKVFKAIVRDYVRPLAWLGAVVGSLALRSRGRGYRAAFAIAIANVVTMIVASALFWGEPRYRVPYDPFLLLLAMISVDLFVVRLPRALANRLRRA